jgi:hypothetical protein
MADESKPDPPKTVRVIQIYNTSDTTARVPVEPINVFPETATIPLPETPPSSPPAPPQPPPQKIAADFCERFNLHKIFTHNGKSWRCMK